MQKARRHRRNSPEGPQHWLRPLVGIWFQVLFRSPPGVLFTFPSRYWFTIGRQEVFSLGRRSSQIPTGFHVSRGTRVPDKGAATLSPTGLSPSVVGFPKTIRLAQQFVTPPSILHLRRSQVPRPRPHNACRLDMRTGLGYFPFARRYSGNRGCFLFLGVLRCFSSPRSPPGAYVFSNGMTGHDPCRVSPFGHLRVKGCLHLTGAFRSLPRPSSPPDAKASTKCP